MQRLKKIVGGLSAGIADASRFVYPPSILEAFRTLSTTVLDVIHSYDMFAILVQPHQLVILLKFTSTSPCRGCDGNLLLDFLDLQR